MGCTESKSSVSARSTVTQNKKPAAAADYRKKVEKEEDVILQKGEAMAKETQEATMLAEVEKKDDVDKEKTEKLGDNVKEEKVPEPEKQNGENEAMKNEEGSTKEAEAVPTVEAPPAEAKTADAIATSEATPPEKKGE